MSKAKINPGTRDLGVEELRASEFPSVLGDSELEIAERTADTDETRTAKYRKEFVLLKVDYQNGDKKAIHRNNRNAVRQAMIAAGLRAYPDEDIAVTTKAHRDGKSVRLFYTIEAHPAAVATDLRLVNMRTDGEAPHVAPEVDELDPKVEGTPSS